MLGAAGRGCWHYDFVAAQKSSVGGGRRRVRPRGRSSIGPAAEATRQGWDHQRRSDQVEPNEVGGGGSVRAGEERWDQRDRGQRHRRPHEPRGGASAPAQESEREHDATSEKKPVTTAIPDNGIVSPPSGTSKSTLTDVRHPVP